MSTLETQYKNYMDAKPESTFTFEEWKEDFGGKIGEQMSDILKEKREKDKTKEYILCAAVWYLELPMVKPDVLNNRGFRPYNVDKGIVFSGWRHGNCIYQMVAITGLKSNPNESGPEVQGFLTNKNRFVDREEAAQIAFDAGQTETLLVRLFSEDLY